MCRQGASVIQTAVLGATDHPTLRAYVAWVPMLPDDGSRPAHQARALVPDGRAVHFWDAGGALPPLFGRVLGLPAGWPAWDVYLAYPPGVVWQDEPPAPAFWQHQLGDLAAAPRLDGAAFAARLREVISTATGPV